MENVSTSSTGRIHALRDSQPSSKTHEVVACSATMRRKSTLIKVLSGAVR